MLGTWRHKRTQKTYVVTKLVRAKVLLPGFVERVWVDGVEYERVPNGDGTVEDATTYVREVPDFMSDFESVDAAPGGSVPPTDVA